MGPKVGIRKFSDGFKTKVGLFYYYVRTYQSLEAGRLLRYILGALN